MSTTIDYFFNYPKSLAETSQDIKTWIGCDLAPYEGDATDLYCRFLGMECSFGIHTLENDRELNFEDFTYEIGLRTPVPDADFRAIQLPVMAFLAYALYQRLHITGMLVFDIQIVLARYREHVHPTTCKKALYDEVSGRVVAFPEHLERLRNCRGLVEEHPEEK